MFDVTKYLPAGTVPIVHYQPWHGSPGHAPLLYPLNGVLVPYDETNPLIITDQVAKMKGWGIKAVNVDYYGVKNAPLQKATTLLLAACASAGLGFSICLDQGAFAAGGNWTEEYIAALAFIAGQYMLSPAYLKDSTGRNFVNFFFSNPEPTIVWNDVTASFQLPTAMLFENAGGFTHANSAGAYGWVQPINPPQNINLDYIKGMISAAAANPKLTCWYPVYPGFDDSLASWTMGRSMVRGCGKTLRSTLAQVPPGAQYALISTWNDHEEGTAIEEGVCVL